MVASEHRRSGDTLAAMIWRWRLALVLGICLAARLWGVGAPLTGVHAWRQCDTAAVARNFAEEGMTLWRPRVDWRGDGPGYAEMEFPAFSYAVAAIYRVMGGAEGHEWVGRLLASLGGVLTCWYVFRLVRWTSGEAAGLWAAAVFAVLPLNVYYGRAFMPESWMLAASAVGIFHFSRWTEARRWWDFGVAAAGISFACLLKLPTLYLGLPLLWLAWQGRCVAGGAAESWNRRAVGVLTDWRLWLFAALVLTPVAAWYWWAHRLGAESGLSFGVWTSDKFAAWDLTLSVRYWYELIVEKILERHLTWAGAVLAVVGICIGRRGLRERLFDVWTVAIFSYFAIVSKGNAVHEYYQLPLAIPAAFYSGRVLAIGWERRAWLWGPLAAAVLVLSGGRLIEYRTIARIKGEPALRLAQFIKESGLNRMPLIAVSGKLPGDPSLLYLADAKGWALSPAVLTETVLGRLGSRGATHVCGVRETFAGDADRAWLGGLKASGIVIRDDEDGFVVELATK